MNSNPKEESEEVLNFLLQFAEQLLQKHGEFFPFAAAMLEDGEVQAITSYDGNEKPESQKVIDNLEEVFVRGAKSNEYRATGLAYMVGYTNQQTGQMDDAVCVNLDHKDDYSVKVFVPYLLNKKLLGKRSVEFFPPTATKGDGKIFQK